MENMEMNPEINIEKKDNNKKVIISSISIMLAIALVALGGAFALWFTTNTQEGMNRVSVLDCLDADLEEISAAIDLDGAYPISNEDGMLLEPYTFAIKNNCDTNLEVDVILAVLPESDLDHIYVRTSLQTAGNNVDNSVVIIPSMLVTPTLLAGSTSYMLNKDNPFAVGPNETVELDFRMWLDEPVLWEQAGGKEFLAKIVLMTARFFVIGAN